MKRSRLPKDTHGGTNEVARRLSRRYGNPRHFNRRNPLDELLFIICSLQTNEALYRRTYKALRRAFPTTHNLAMASEAEISQVIKDGGLANQKARHVRRIMDGIISKFGRLTLAPLRYMTDQDCERFLCSLPGVGKKTSRCVMMYSLDREVFPVDANCWRIARRLGWVRRTRKDGSCSPRDMDRLQDRVAPHLRHSLHVNMVSLGRDCCTPRSPSCCACPLVDLCPQRGLPRLSHQAR